MQIDDDEYVENEDFAADVGELPGLDEEDVLVILLDDEGEEGAEAARTLLADEEFLPKKVYYVAGGADAWQVRLQ